MTDRRVPAHLRMDPSSALVEDSPGRLELRVGASTIVEVACEPKEGPPVALKPRLTPFLFILSILTGLLFVTLHYALIPWLNAPYSQAWYVWIVLHM